MALRCTAKDGKRSTAEAKMGRMVVAQLIIDFDKKLRNRPFIDGWNAEWCAAVRAHDLGAMVALGRMKADKRGICVRDARDTLAGTKGR